MHASTHTVHVVCFQVMRVSASAIVNFQVKAWPTQVSSLVGRVEVRVVLVEFVETAADELQLQLRCKMDCQAANKATASSDASLQTQSYLPFVCASLSLDIACWHCRVGSAQVTHTCQQWASVLFYARPYQSQGIYYVSTAQVGHSLAPAASEVYGAAVTADQIQQST